MTREIYTQHIEPWVKNVINSASQISTPNHVSGATAQCSDGGDRTEMESQSTSPKAPVVIASLPQNDCISAASSPSSEKFPGNASNFHKKYLNMERGLIASLSTTALSSETYLPKDPLSTTGTFTADLRVDSFSYIQLLQGLVAQTLQQIQPPFPQVEEKLHRIIALDYNKFVGRKKYLKNIEKKLLDDEFGRRGAKHFTPFYTICGSPGQGKTQTALRFTYQHKGRFSYILFVPADSENKLLVCMSRFALDLGIADQESKDLIINAKALVKWFGETGE